MRTIFCVPGKDYPGDKNIEARVIDDFGVEYRFHFGADVRIKRAAGMIPMLWEHASGKRRRKAKGVVQ